MFANRNFFINEYECSNEHLGISCKKFKEVTFDFKEAQWTCTFYVSSLFSCFVLLKCTECLYECVLLLGVGFYTSKLESFTVPIHISFASLIFC